MGKIIIAVIYRHRSSVETIRPLGLVEV